MADTHAERPTERKILHCVVVTPERALLDETADFVAVPMIDGELGVLPGRAPLIGRLGYGELRIRKGTTTQRYFIDGGFVQIRANTVTVLTARALRPTEIDANAARQALTHTREPVPTEQAQDARLKAQARARAQLRLLEHGVGQGEPAQHG